MRTRLVLSSAVMVFAAMLGVVPRGVPTTEAAGPGTWTEAGDMTVRRRDPAVVLLPNGRVLAAAGQESGGAGAYLATAETYNPATNAWSATNPMSQARYQAPMVLLRDGRALIVGGWDGGTGTATAEVYNASTNSWSAAAPVATPRYRHTATLLTDGRVLVTGGTDTSLPGTTAASEIYDPVADAWAPAAPMSFARGLHTATLLGDGRVLVAGYSGQPETYDPVSNTWSPAGTMVTERINHSATYLPDGRVLIAGGSTIVGPGTVLTSAEIFDPTTNSWSPTGSMTMPRALFTLTLTGNGKVLAAGGDDGSPDTTGETETYDPTTGVWTTAGGQGWENQDRGTVVLQDGRILSAGANKHLFGTLDFTAELYDPTAWVPVAPMSTARGSFASTLMWSGKVLVAGGYNGGELTSAELYDPAADQWAPVNAMAAASGGQAVLLRNGKLLVTGGPSAEVFNPVSGTWTTVGNLGEFRYIGRLTLLKSGHVLNSGGWDEGVVSARAETFDPATSVWTATGDLNGDRVQHTASLLADGRVVATNGFGSGVDGTTIYDSATGTWSPGADRPGFGKMSPVEALLPNARVLVAGGSWSGGMGMFLGTSESNIYDPTTDTWGAGPSMLQVRMEHAAATLLDGRFLVAGGRASNQHPASAGAEIYDPASNSWRSAGSMNVARIGLSLLTLPNGNVLALGPDASAEMFDLGIHTDTDGDGYNDGLELALGQHPWLTCKTMRADVSRDGLVNVADLGRVAAQTGKRPPPSRIDQNGDKVINVADLGLTASQSGKSVLSCA